MIEELEEDEIFYDFLNDFDGNQQITFQEFNEKMKIYYERKTISQDENRLPFQQSGTVALNEKEEDQIMLESN